MAFGAFTYILEKADSVLERAKCSSRRLFKYIEASADQLIGADTPVVERARRRLSDIAPRVRRRLSDLEPVVARARRRLSDLAPIVARARRRLSDFVEVVVEVVVAAAPKVVRRRFTNLPEQSGAKFVPDEFFGSPYQKWAAKYFSKELWRALPQEDVDDLIQDAYFKYRRCLELYVYGRNTCRGPKHLMLLFKTACNNMLIDRSRKKMRCPEKYQCYEVDSSRLVDNSLLAALEF